MNRLVISCFNRSGIYHYATQLAQGIAETGKWEVLFITSSYNPSNIHPSHPAIRTIVIPAPHSPLSFIKATVPYVLYYHARILHEIHKFQPQIIHIIDAYPWYFFWNKLFRKYPTAVTIHDPESHSGEKLAWILSSVNFHLLKKSKLAIVHGNALKQGLERKNIKNIDIAVIPLGNFNFFQKWKTTTQSFPNSILFFGRIVQYKGIDILLQATEILLKRGFPIHVTIAGEGNMEPYRQYISPFIKKHLTIQNEYIPDEKVPKLFQSNTIVILPYKEATQSAVIPIAFALGKPIIASSVGAIPEVIQHEKNGILIPPSNPQALANAIQRLLSDTSLQKKLAEEGYKTTQQTLSWSRIGEMHNKAYEDILER